VNTEQNNSTQPKTPMKNIHFLNLHNFAFAHFGHGAGAAGVGVILVAIGAVGIVAVIFSARGK
jgi:hypothetical protein